MQERNPYAAPSAPVIAADEPTRLPDDPADFEYGGFWRRLGALMLDGLIMLPLTVLLFVLVRYTRNAYLYYALVSVPVSVVYYVYLVKRFGGTPGKLVTRMRITMQDGSPVSGRAALLRYLPFLTLQVLSLVALIVGSSALRADFESLGYIEKMQAFQLSAPSWNKAVTALTYIWLLATAITLVANRRKRTTHDFIAGTIVLRTD